MEKTSAIPKEMDAEGREYVILHTKLLFNNIEPCKIVINKKKSLQFVEKKCTFAELVRLF